MADGKVHQAMNQSIINYKWQGKMCRVETYIMKDAHLAFDLISGLDFLQAAEAILDIGQNRYGLKTETSYKFYPFLTSSITPESAATQENNLNPAALTLYYALPPIWEPNLITPNMEPVPCWDSDNQEELRKVMVTWPLSRSLDQGMRRRGVHKTRGFNHQHGTQETQEQQGRHSITDKH